MQAATRREYTEKYSRGRRGAPAKGVGRDNRRESSNLSISAKNTEYPKGCSVFFCFDERFEISRRLAGKRVSEPTAACGGRRKAREGQSPRERERSLRAWRER